MLESKDILAGKEIVDFWVGDEPNAFGNPSSLCEGRRPCQAKVGGGGGVGRRSFFSSFRGDLFLGRDPDADEAERIDQVK